MVARLNFCLMVMVFLCAHTIVFTQKNADKQANNVDVSRLRQLFAEAVSKDLEIVKDELKERSTKNGGGTYWLVYVKPKRSGHFAIKYTYKYHDKFYEEGENTLYIRAGGKICSRYPQPYVGIANVCLGDTVIVPIRIHNFSEHTFSLKYTNEEPQSIDETKRSSNPYIGDLNTEQISNPLSANLKYLGTQRTENLHRNGGVTIVYSAIFEAKSAGKFSLVLSPNVGDNEPTYKPTKISAGNSTPIIIVNPGTSITALIPKEETICYADKRAFSSHSGNNFLTNLLILQPGDVFSVEYFHETRRPDYMYKAEVIKRNDIKVVPVINKQPFLLSADWNFNEWIVDYLPKENAL